MPHTATISALTAVVTAVLTVFAIEFSGLRPEAASSAVGEGAPTGGAQAVIQGDVDCDGAVDAVDALAVLVNVADLEALAQQEPCTDVADVIPAGISDIHVETNTETVGPNAVGATASAECPDGATVLGGGGTIVDSKGSDIFLKASFPWLNAWNSYWYSADGVSMPEGTQLTAFAVCANVAQ